MKIRWTASRKPTKAELAAVRRAVLDGRLQEGDRVTPDTLRAARRQYEAFHWGRKPRRVTSHDVDASPVLYELGKLRRVEYEARKGDEHAIYYHDFTEPYPVLTATPSGKLGPIVGGRARVHPRGIVR